jgi:hypothetical protein
MEPKKRGMCAVLGSYVFDHGDKGAADQVKITWEKLTNRVAALYGTNIGTELATNVNTAYQSQCTLPTIYDSMRKLRSSVKRWLSY